MSTIGSGIGAASLASSAAGAQQNRTDTNQVKAAAADQTFRIGQQEMTSRSLDSVGQSDVTPDRDADGRQGYDRPTHDDAEDEFDPNHEDSGLPQPVADAADVFGILGQTLDLEA